MYNDGRSVATPSALADLNGDGVWDVLGMANRVAWGRGDGGFAIGQWSVAGAEGLPAFRHLLGAYDVNADGRLDLLYIDSARRLVVGLANADGSYSNGAAALGWDQNLGPITTTASLQAVDVNNDRSLDLIAMLSGALGTSAVVLNSTAVAENTFLRVVVANERGGLDAYGATVRLYDQASGALVAMREASSTSMAVTANAGSYGADFFGLDPAKTYDVVVVYPGSDQQVTVLTGKAGLGVAGIHPSALNQIVDSRLTGVSPGGKDVVWVAKENRSTSTNGGYWQGSGLADQMVGDRGNDVFKPNGARIGEAGDTLTGGGGKDRYVFDVKAVLNTGATITDFGANAGAEADSIDIGALLTSLGYTGARTAAAASGWVRLVDSGGHSTLQIDAHSGSGGAASGFVDLVRLNGVTGKTLADLVSGGFVHLGGLQLSNVPIDQVASETASLAGIRLAAGATLAAEGGQWAAGFGGGQLVVSLEHATASDTLGLANTDGVSYDAVSRAVRIGGTQVATVDPTLNGVGAVGQLAMVFDFSSAGASYSTEAQQATAVQTVLRAVQLSSSTPAPLAIDRGITFRLTDALGDTQEVMSGLDITPEANRVTVGGVNFVTGTESVETLVGTSADETLVGYNGVPTAANLANLGTALTFGDTLTGGGGKDTFQWLKLQVMNSDASDRITDFGLKGGTGTGQGAAEADVIDLAAMLEGFNNGSTVSDFVRAANVGGKVQIQVDYNGKANGSAFENTWFMTLDNLTVNANNEVVANNATVAATAQGLTGNLTIDTLVQQMVADSQFKLL